MAQNNQKVNRTIPQPTKRLKRAFKREISLDWYIDKTPTPEEWEYLTADEPELTYLKDQIRKKGFISEEI